MRIRSGYSFRTAFGTIENVASRLKEIGWPRQPITDRNSCFAFNRWSKIVPQPIYGVELAVVRQLNEKKQTPDWWTFLATKELKSINSLVSLATWQSEREPELNYKQAIQAKDVIKIAGEHSQISQFKPRKDLYIALSPATSKGFYNEAKKKGFQFIAVSDNYYPRAEDKETYRLALGKRSTTQTYPLWILSDEEWKEAIQVATPAEKQKALTNRNKVFAICIAKLQKASLVIPEHPATLRQMCERGAKKLNVNLKNKIYNERLSHELKLIHDKKFEDYFYIIADIVSWAKERMIVGPARGSSCGSLVCYLLGITTVDPIEYGLIFERFVDINRNDLPDIDIDFSDNLRKLVFDYVEEKYGSERTARLGTVGMFRPRSALAAAGKSLAIPAWKIDKVLDALIFRSSGDSRALFTLEDTLKETGPGTEFLKEFPEALAAAPLEGHPTNASQHAAGVIITQEPIVTYVAVDGRTNSAMCDKKDAEDLGMLKIDMLGLTQLSVFERTLELIGVVNRDERTNIAHLKDGGQLGDYFKRLPLDDPSALNVLNNHQWSGIFQFNGPALQSIAKLIHTDNIEDIISMTALARPGPMASGGTNHWTRRKNGSEEVTFAHEVFRPYTEVTLGVVTFQEQVMQIGREVGGLSWDDVTQLPRAMSRSLGKEFFDKYGDRWKAGAIKKGVPNAVAEKYWDDLCSYGSWAFNRSHAVAYGLVSYYCCWLKAHYPSEFAAATLDSEKDPNRQLLLLRELHNEGIDYIPVDINRSTDRWTIDKKGRLLGPLTMIKGIGSVATIEIMNSRNNGKSLRKGLITKLSNPRTPIDSIYPVTDAVKRLAGDERPNITISDVDLSPFRIRSQATLALEVKPVNRYYTVVVIGVLTRLTPRDENETINIVKRGGRVMTGPTRTLNFWIRDDTDEVFCKIGRFDFHNLDAKKFMDTSRVGKTLVAVKGDVPPDFRMLRVKNFRILGEIDADIIPSAIAKEQVND